MEPEKLKLEPLGQRDPRAVRADRAGRKLAPQRNKAIGATLVKAWQNAQSVDDQQVAAFQPTTLDALVAEALLNGETGPKAIGFYCGVSAERVKRVLSNPVATAWISRTLKSLFTHRIGMVDSALFQRSMTGDPGACKLMYERLGQLSQDQTIRHVYSGGVNVTALSTEDLRRLVAEKGRLLDASFRVIEGGEGKGTLQEVAQGQSGEGSHNSGELPDATTSAAPDTGRVQDTNGVSELRGTEPGLLAFSPPRSGEKDDIDRLPPVSDQTVLE